MSKEIERKYKKIKNLYERQIEITDEYRSKLSELEIENKELKEVLRGWLNCNCSEAENIQKSKEILMNGKLTNNTNK